MYYLYIRCSYNTCLHWFKRHFAESKIVRFIFRLKPKLVGFLFFGRRSIYHFRWFHFFCWKKIFSGDLEII